MKLLALQSTSASMVSFIAKFHYAGKAWLRKEYGIGPIQSEEVNV